MTPTSSHYAMAAFALAASISPGPVNILLLREGATAGYGRGLQAAAGATVSFVVLLVLCGLLTRQVVEVLPWLNVVLHWGGVAFLAWMAWQLLRDTGHVAKDDALGHRHRMLQTAALQWVNPKAWIAAVAGMGLFAAGGEVTAIAEFAAIYFGVCLVSMSLWAIAGAWLAGRLTDARHLRRLNRCLAVLLALTAVSMVLTGVR